MSTTGLSTEEVCERGRKIYGSIRSKLEGEHHGEYLFIDVDTGEYEFGKDQVEVSRRAQARIPNGHFYGVRIGFDYFGRVGGWRKGNQS